ncbi:hypothetical protein L596_021994 [Steinernema carpocapsae]|uniref:Uncharacterized protein n=1 Tax=Steinernema carpocapsae TaxID=34508 RepID=A0A4U5ML91_STECR|nr:hypothetical protein L596_021994 [Steinernema carpocapsae]
MEFRDSGQTCDCLDALSSETPSRIPDLRKSELRCFYANDVGNPSTTLELFYNEENFKNPHVKLLVEEISDFYAKPDNP